MNARKIISLVLAASVSAAALGGQFFRGPYQVAAYQVLDGDTVRISLPVWFDISAKFDLRIRGIDAPETRKGVKGGKPIPLCEIEAGHKAKAFLEAELAGKTMTVSNLSEGVYVGRLVGDVTLQGGIDVARRMIATSHAVPYDGKKAREPWDCSLQPTTSGPEIRQLTFKRSA